MSITKTAQQVKRTLLKKVRRKKKKKKPKRRDLLSTGSTLLNLLCSGCAFGGFLKGKIFYIVGDSTSGKTFLCMTCFAEAMRNKYFKDYRIIYDNVEDGMLMDVVRLFGQTVADKIEPPEKDEDGPVWSETIDEFYFHVDDAVQDGRPFIYVLDSMDGLVTNEDEKKFDEKKKAHRAGGKKVRGSYGMEKAKANSIGLRKVKSGLRDSGSILIIISQTRDNPDAMPFSPRKTHSGGKSLKFYATVEVWSSVVQKIKKTVRGKKRQVGVKIKLQAHKNRITGKLHEVETCIYPSYGMDDIGSCVDYLVSESWWKKKGHKINAEELGLLATRDKLILQIEEEGLIRDLQSITGKCWREIEKACALKRKRRYE